MDKIVASILAAIAGCVAGSAVASNKKGIRRKIDSEMFTILENHCKINDLLLRNNIAIAKSNMAKDTKIILSSILKDRDVLSTDLLVFLEEYIKDRPKGWSINRCSLKEKATLIKKLRDLLANHLKDDEAVFKYIQVLAHEIGLSMDQLNELALTI